MEKYSPMMQAYLELKKNYQDAIVFYRLGDFYEMFFDDAKIASNELNLVLTGKNAGVEDRVPMCGVPHHAATSYVNRLVQRGYKVAIVEQMEDPKLAKGIVKRDVIRVVTPGTVMDDNDDKTSIYIAAVSDYQYGLALAICEMSTGETFLKKIDRNQVKFAQELLKDNIKEVILKEDFDNKYVMMLREMGSITISYCDVADIEERYQPLVSDVKEFYYLEAYGRMLNYLSNTSRRMLDHLRPVVFDNDDMYLQMDYSTRCNLEVVENARNGIKSMTLWQYLDHTQTAMGARLLKKWLEKPLLKEDKIKERQRAISYLKENFRFRNQLKEKLSEIYDMERLIARVAYGNANAIDGLRLSRSLNALEGTFGILKDMDAFQYIHELDLCNDLQKKLENAFVENPPVSTKEGGMFVDGYNEKLDEYRKIQRDGKSIVAELEATEREKTGIKTLKVGYNKVFGYYFEVSKSFIPMIPAEEGYIKKQTLVNAERFITPALKEIEDNILHAEERALGLEEQLFNDLIQEMKQYLPKLQKIADAVALIDVIYSLSVISSQKKYCLPEFNHEGIVDIKKGRHPILDTEMKERRFVANDLTMDDQKRIMILTGPNMGGKSTYMRQNAILVIMAQIGCYVPADRMNVPLFDQIFTRIGANDDILGGQSTFMVEMNEANNALQNATKNSLIIFDEIGRGTSTYDGMALAQSMIEYIARYIGAVTLFSTHYHELTRLEDSIDKVVNYFVEVHEEDNTVTFLYHVKKGKVNKSYGINVARLAKLPDEVIQRAQSILKNLESNHKVIQQTLLVEEETPKAAVNNEIEEKLKMIDINAMTPIAALQMINDLQEEIKKRES